MAGPVSVAAGLLLLALCAYHLAPTGSVAIPISCCMTFVSKKIPESRVISYQLSNGSVCPKAGVIFTTKKGLSFCGDPKQQWVQKYMKKLDAKQKRASMRAKAVGAKVPAQRRPGNSTTS
ncbi:C-C motif chemokine 24 [Microcebus murinus]|uniref:C-C motif chemokine ligand 24 n=1 Tax=Microcebus murinus TaxID=30608 RepID=A0A8C5Y5G9_MICMU|nr:C-C motif chemokine 24-like [Microcebus murinus]XP_012614333.1 C-C motif chemokine 24 [Microcebus murinus]